MPPTPPRPTPTTPANVPVVHPGIRDRLRQFDSRIDWDEEQEVEAAEDIALDFCMFDGEIKLSHKKNGSLNGSGTLFASDSLLQVKDGMALSSRSAYDEESDSRSNSELFSSTSYGTNSFLCSRSRSFQSQEEEMVI